MFLTALSVVTACLLVVQGEGKHGGREFPIFVEPKIGGRNFGPFGKLPHAAPGGRGPAAAKRPAAPVNNDCHEHETSEMRVRFCTKDQICEGFCAGGVYKGLLKCKLDSDPACQAKFGVKMNEEKSVIVKFNHRRVGGGKDEQMHRLEIKRMQQLAGKAHVVQLYGLIDLRDGLRAHGKTFIMPGMVMEYLAGKSMAAHLDEFKHGRVTADQAIREFPCMMEQTALAVYAMIKQGFTHSDLNPGNMVRSGEQYTSATTGVTCPLIKVIDFGYTQDVPMNHLEQVGAISLYAYQMDSLAQKYISKAKSAEDKLVIKAIIRPSPTTVNIFQKPFRKGMFDEARGKIVRMCKGREKIKNSYCYTLLHTAKPTGEGEINGKPQAPGDPRHPQPAGLIPIRGRPGWYKEETGEFSVEFCTNVCFKEGDCAGGVFRGTLVCTLASNDDCKKKFGIDRLVAQDVVVKFNEKGSEVPRNVFEFGRLVGQRPATDTKKEIAAMQALSLEEHVVKLYGLLATSSKTPVQLGSKTFLTPGMVMEFLPGGSVAAALNKRKISNTHFPCILEQATRAALAMIKKGYLHVDMHLANLVLTGSTYSSGATQCPFIKVIDFGYIQEVKRDGQEVRQWLKLLVTFATRMDETYGSSMVKVSQKTVDMLKDFLKELSDKGINLDIGGNCRTGKAFCSALVNLTHRNLLRGPRR